MQGGTGSSAFNLKHPDYLPDSLESGTPNTWGIIALKEGIDFVNSKTASRIYSHETALCDRFIKGVKDSVTVYRDENYSYVPVVSFNVEGSAPEETAEYLNRQGFCLRAGLHCAPLAHHTIGTENGTVRFSPSVFNSRNQVDDIVKIIKSYAKFRKSY